jgi:endonuclease YncB( thermonuclease family)
MSPRHSLFIALSLLLIATAAEAGEPRSKVIINGQAAPVFFNDGDSFRVLSGRMKGAKARIAGYNTLESHGAVHSWGSWTVKEMYVLAKMATLHARRGVWECTTDGKTDTYGRMLTHCHGLGKELIRLGLAHAMSVNDDPADPEYLKAQREAMQAKRGIWAHGTPAFVVTSLHSVEEDTTGHGTYNRLVSTADGHSVKWKHTNKYPECMNVCQKVYSVDESKLETIAIALKKSDAAGAVKGISGKDLVSVVKDYARYRHINRKVSKDDREDVKKVLDFYESKGKFGKQKSKNGSCMVHVPFKRRFGGTRAKCLR